MVQKRSVLLLLTMIATLARTAEVLMVIGGQSFNSTTRGHDHISQVEVIGSTNSCVLPHPFPTPVYGLTAGRVGDSVVACGGFLHYYRAECYMFSKYSGQWSVAPGLGAPTAFPAAVAVADEYFVGGGRTWVYGVGGGRDAASWRFYDTFRVFRSGSWEALPPLPYPVADACMAVTTNGGRRRLWLMGGSDFPQRYKPEVFTMDLNSPSDGWTPMPPMLEARMWQQCTATVIEGNLGILVVGGYYNGGSSMWLPLADRQGNSLEVFGPRRDLPKWEWLSSLSQERKWLPAMGYVGEHLTLAGGGDYGDETVETLHGRDWRRSRVKMHYKREFAVGVSVPQEWFPECAF